MNSLSPTAWPSWTIFHFHLSGCLLLLIVKSKIHVEVWQKIHVDAFVFMAGNGCAKLLEAYLEMYVCFHCQTVYKYIFKKYPHYIRASESSTFREIQRVRECWLVSETSAPPISVKTWQQFPSEASLGKSREFSDCLGNGNTGQLHTGKCQWNALISAFR